MDSFTGQKVGAPALLAGMALALISGCAAAATVAAASMPMIDIEARVSYETRQVMSSGVTRVDTWQEHLVRRGNQVWTERILTPAAQAGHSHDGHKREPVAERAGHRHLNAETSARWLTLQPDGQVEVRLVDRENRVVVNVPRAEFGTVGFDGRFDGAASIVPPAVVRAMAPTTARPVRGSADDQWLTDRSQGWSHKLLWSASKQMALRVESTRDDGSVQRRVTVQLLPAAPAKPMPWNQLTDYTPKQYDDFMD